MVWFHVTWWFFFQRVLFFLRKFFSKKNQRFLSFCCQKFFSFKGSFFFKWFVFFFLRWFFIQMLLSQTRGSNFPKLVFIEQMLLSQKTVVCFQKVFFEWFILWKFFLNPLLNIKFFFIRTVSLNRGVHLKKWVSWQNVSFLSKVMGFFSEGVLIFQFFCSKKLFFVKGFFPWFNICILDFSQGFFQSFLFKVFFAKFLFVFLEFVFQKVFSLSFFSRVFFSEGFFKFVIRVCVKIVFSSATFFFFFLQRGQMFFTLMLARFFFYSRLFFFSRFLLLRQWQWQWDIQIKSSHEDQPCPTDANGEVVTSSIEYANVFAFFKIWCFFKTFFFIFTRSSTLPYGLEWRSRGFIEKTVRSAKSCVSTQGTRSVSVMRQTFTRSHWKKGDEFANYCVDTVLHTNFTIVNHCHSQPLHVTCSSFFFFMILVVSGMCTVPSRSVES